ncbi:DNA starvation/stationary phase protection protein [Helicobacter monodelphidis]|uniref:Dps family protein n=1 Tax=Helicobacter sp. 15-1451 TaxID=2004995 RepID=UPI000DCD7484|nr:DNA starvation/stationary phase protection protein [Helicobacter sp. 15-1451]RAX57349.1 DNA starvation/stationary phase protection protein [Helicobacter sp. 15-1451]
MSSIISLLKGLEADAIVLHMKLHNYHWNVKGMDFHPVHAATEEMYENFATLFDDLAERILQLSDKPITTLKEALEKASVKEESGVSFTSKQIVESILKDYELLYKKFKELSKAAADNDDSVTAALADDKLAALEKSIWMFKAQLA